MKKSRQKLLALGVVALSLVIAVGIAVAGSWWGKDEEQVAEGSYEAFDPNSKPSTGSESVPFDLAELRKQGKPILIDFTATWCIPCKTFNPILNEVKEEYADKVIIELVDVDKYRSFATYYPLRGIPSQLLYNSDGEPFIPQNAEVSGLFGFRTFRSGEEIVTLHEGTLSKESLLVLLERMGLEL